MARDPLVEIWLVNNRVNLLVLEELDAEGLRCTLSTRGGRTVGQQLAHVVAVRRTWVELSDKRAAANLPAIAREDAHDGKLLERGFDQSGEAIAVLIEKALADGEKVKGFKRGVTGLVGYLIAHEAHHRGGALLTLKKSGWSLSERLRWGIWDWNRI